MNPQIRNIKPPPCWRRKPSSHVRNLSHCRPQRLLQPSQNVQRSPDLQNLLSRLTLLLPLLLCSLCQNLTTTIPGRQRNPRERLRLTQASLLSGSSPMWRKMRGNLTGGGNFGLFCTPRMSAAPMTKSKDYPTGKLWPSDCHLPNWKRAAGGVLCPAY